MDPLAAAAGGGSVRGLAALALPNSSSLTAWAPVAIMAVPVTICSSTFFWYPIASMSLFSKGLASLLQNAASLLCTNPAESMLCALVSAWALASANILGRYPRSSLRQLQHKARDVYKLAGQVIKKRMSREASWTRHWHLPSPPTSKEQKRFRPGVSFQLTPGPRFVIKWATDDTFASLKADQATSQRSSDPQMEQRKLLKAHALTDLAEHVASLPASGFSFDWGGINLSSYIYWPELSWSTLGTRDCISHGSEDQVDTHVESSRSLDCNLMHQNPRSWLCHSHSMPVMRSSDIPGASGNAKTTTDTVEGQLVPNALTVRRGQGAVSALKASKSEALSEDLRSAVPDSFVLQFAALLGEEDAASVIQSSGLQSAFSSPEALFGLADKEAPWDELVVESRPGVMTYRAYKRPLRRGINMYWTVSVMEDASVQELRRFTLDDQNRSKWDDNCMGCIQLLPPEPLGPSPPHETCFVYLKAKFPRPMAARDYVYARRVVDCPEGGGAYIVQVPCLEGRHPSFQQLSGRIVRVSDFTSCTRIRAVKSPSGRQEGAVELSMIYFEDSKVPASLMNMAVGKGLWPFVQRQEAAFRCYQATLRRRSQSLELVGQPSSARCQWDAPSAVDATESGFHLAQPTCSRNSSSGNLSEVEYSALQPKPGSRGARWNRRLLVAAVLCSRILNTLAPAS